MKLQTISLSKMERSCTEVTLLLRSLSHPGRLMVLGHLIGGEKSVCELQELSGLSQSQLSQFLGRMRLEGLIACRREGRFQFYSTADDRVNRLIQALHEIFCA